MRKLCQAEVRRARVAFARHSLEKLRALQRLHRSADADVRRNRVVLETEWITIEADGRWALEHAGDSNLAADLCVEFAFAGLAGGVLGHLYPGQRSAWQESLLKFAQERLLGDEEGGSLDFAYLCHELAGLYYTLGRDNDAEPLYRQALAIFGAAAQAPEAPPDERLDYAALLENLATLRHRMGRSDEAELLFQEAIDLRRSLLGEDHVSVAAPLKGLAAVYKDTN